jgi:diguanylate cyclase (GGDEF)-like protein
MFGDVVIKGIADTISQISQYRDDIIAARYGGEEFVIIFDNVNFDEVCKIVEQLHKNIMKKEFENKGEIIHVNVSIGIASYPETCDNPQALLNRSDWAMYYSKQNGRGRITIDNPEVDKLRK